MRGELRAITFDCWGTLIYEPDLRPSFERRVAAVSIEVPAASSSAVRAALDAAWRRSITLWEEGIASGPTEIAAWALAPLGVDDPERAQRLGRALGEASRSSEIAALDGAVATLEAIAAAGLRRALVCDTGFTPGHLVRELLDRAGLLAHLEVCVFSDEAGVPKPHPRVFEAALEPLGARPHEAAHVGDLRRTDVAGARGAGLRAIRIRWHHDDVSEHPEADAVVDSHAALRDLLGV